MSSNVAASRAPIVIGPSRITFIGQSTGISRAEDRDAATIAAVTVGVMKGSNLVRVHNVKAVQGAVRFADVICRHTQPACEKEKHHSVTSVCLSSLPMSNLLKVSTLRSRVALASSRDITPYRTFFVPTSGFSGMGNLPSASAGELPIRKWTRQR